MRIPIDYYQILGLPIQTSAEQLQQAYRDRTQQQPQREYSQAAIEARNQLIALAYQVLSDPEQRQRYDASYFASTYEAEDDRAFESLARHDAEPIPAAFEPNTPSIEIADELFVGALLILQELGEYELVLELGRAFFSTNSVTLERADLGEFNLVRPDIVLTVALAYLELGREQWQQGQYENAAASLESGRNLLSREGLFPGVAGEIKADLDKLRPYRILELLAQPEANVAERQQGLQLLQDILQERRGIDGTGNDGSGLSVEDFLRFIQQLRSYLSAAEQQSLFEAESQRPSAVATYLAVYALIARGFAERLPGLILQAKQMLLHLGKRQDLYLEQAICSLLLGQTTQASRALELSQEYEPLALIRENSQGAQDLLPGLCLYSENWLHNEVFPNFRDLATQRASLKEYFADEMVQTYLEALPTELEADNGRTVEQDRQSPQLAAPSHYLQPGSDRALASPSLSNNGLEQPNQKAIAKTARSRELSKAGGDREARKAGGELATHHSPPASSLAVLPEPEGVNSRTATKNQNPTNSALSQVQLPPQGSRRRTRNRFARKPNGGERGKPPFHPHGNSNTSTVGNLQAAKKKRLVLLLASSVLGIVILWFLASQVYSLFKHIFAKAPSAPEEQLIVALNQPPIPIPEPKRQQPAVAEILNQATATQVIQSWLSTKSAAFGPKHAIDKLEQILVQPALLQWQKRVQDDKANNRYRQYKHSIKIDTVKTKASAQDLAQVEATVNEVAQVYEKGRLNRASSYSEAIRVQYDLVRRNNQWRIQAMKVLK